MLKDGGDVTGEALRDAILEIKTFESPVAKIIFETNTASRPIEIRQFQGSERALITVENPSE